MGMNRRQFLGASAAALSVAGLSTKAIGAEFNYKLGHSTPVHHPFSQRLLVVSKEVLEKTNGRLNIAIFPASQLGGDNDLLAQVRTGAVEFFPGAGLIMASILPVTAINGMGFAWSGYDKIWPAMDGGLGAYIRKQLVEKTSLVPMTTMWNLGFRQITNTVRPIHTADDLKGLKLRVPGAPPLLSMFQALGVAAVSMQFGEVYTALQTKVVDGQENPLATINSAKFAEVQTYLSLTNHVWDGFWMLANGAAWKRLPKDVQQITDQVFTEQGLGLRSDLVKLNKGLVDTLKSQGMKVNSTTPDSFRAKLVEAGFYTEWKKRIGSEAWDLLEKYAGKLG